MKTLKGCYENYMCVFQFNNNQRMICWFFFSSFSFVYFTTFLRRQSYAIWLIKLFISYLLQISHKWKWMDGSHESSQPLSHRNSRILNHWLKILILWIDIFCASWADESGYTLWGFSCLCKRPSSDFISSFFFSRTLLIHQRTRELNSSLSSHYYYTILNHFSCWEIKAA